MRIERTKNATRNIAVGTLLKIYQMLGPFAVRTVMIYTLGMEYLGLNSLFTSILQVLNLAELGVGSAMVYSMYKPIAEDDSVTICALMKLYRKYYHFIGLIILIAGLCITPFIPNLISGDVPVGINIYILYLLNLGATVLSYWLFAYKNCILTAHQRTDVISLVTIIVNTVMYIAQALCLFVGKNYYAYLIATLLSQALLNIMTAVASDRHYPQYKAKGNLDKAQTKQINQRIKDLFTSKVGEVIVNSADSIVISAFLGLTILASYNSYYYILNSIIGFVMIIFNACTAGIGNSLIVETEEKNFNDLKKFTFIISWLAGFCACCLLCLYQPFMGIWIGEEYLFSIGCVICFAIYFYVREVNQLLILYKDAAGMWHEDRFRPLVTALTNLVMNLIMVQFMGIYGVLLSTVLSTLIAGMPWVLHNLFTVVFKRPMGEYVRRIIMYAFVTLAACAITFGLCLLFDFGNLGNLILRAVICVIVPNLFYFVIYHKRIEFKEMVKLLDKMVGGKISFVHSVCTKLCR